MSIKDVRFATCRLQKRQLLYTNVAFPRQMFAIRMLIITFVAHINTNLCFFQSLTIMKKQVVSLIAI